MLFNFQQNLDAKSIFIQIHFNILNKKSYFDEIKKQSFSSY